MESVQPMIEWVTEYGFGAVAVAIVFISFVLQQCQIQKANKENSEKQVDALKKVAASNDNVAQALGIIKDTFVDRVNVIDIKVDKTLEVVYSHKLDSSRDFSKIEDKCDKGLEFLTKIEERTK